MRYRVDHGLACFKGLREIFCLEGSVCNHGQSLHARNRVASKPEFVDEIQYNFFVFVCIIVARKDARDQRQSVLCETDLDRG